MIFVSIPGFEDLKLENILFDFNGTLAVDGVLIDGVKERLNVLSNKLKIFVVTGDTFGTAREQLDGLNCELIVAEQFNQSDFKLQVLKKIGCKKTVAVGNGNNDVKILKEAVLGIAVLESEGVSTKAVLSADVLVKNIHNAFDLILNTTRLKATLRV
jgi:P-type E1-E2 ATPase